MAASIIAASTAICRTTTNLDIGVANQVGQPSGAGLLPDFNSLSVSGTGEGQNLSTVLVLAQRSSIGFGATESVACHYFSFRADVTVACSADLAPDPVTMMLPILPIMNTQTGVLGCFDDDLLYTGLEKPREKSAVSRVFQCAPFLLGYYEFVPSLPLPSSGS